MEKGRVGAHGIVRPLCPLTHSPALPLRLAAWLAVALIVIWLLSMTLRPGSQPNGINLVPFSQKWPALICLLEPNCLQQSDAISFLFVDVSGQYRCVRSAGCGAGSGDTPETNGRREQQSSSQQPLVARRSLPPAFCSA